MHTKAIAPSVPLHHLLLLVHAVVVRYQVDVEVLGHLVADLP